MAPVWNFYAINIMSKEIKLCYSTILKFKPNRKTSIKYFWWVDSEICVKRTCYKSIKNMFLEINLLEIVFAILKKCVLPCLALVRLEAFEATPLLKWTPWCIFQRFDHNFNKTFFHQISSVAPFVANSKIEERRLSGVL